MVLNVFATAEWLASHQTFLANISGECHEIEAPTMKKISTLSTPSDVLILLKGGRSEINYDIFNAGHAIFLDDVQDPGNVGTIVRIADWFGISTVIRSPGSADFFNPKVIQATMGSFLNVHLPTSDYFTINRSRHKTVGAGMSGLSVNSLSGTEKTLLVVGNESKGLSAEIEKNIDQLYHIEGATGRVADSLNVAIATSIFAHKLCQI